jgi:polyhydroxyalkanoate synthesis regulator phasin
MACYHVPDRAGASVERSELEVLKEKINQLEEKLDQERYVGRAELVERLGRLEEAVDKGKAENDSEMKNVHRAMGGLWQHIGILEKRTPQQEDRIEGLLDDVERMRHQFMEVDDASMQLEDRVEALENASTPLASTRSRRRKVG